MKTARHLAVSIHLAIACLLLPKVTLSFYLPKPAKVVRQAIIALVSLQNVSERQVARRRFNVIETDDPSALTFSGNIVRTSQPLVPVAGKDILIDFFKSPRARDTLFVSDATPIRVDPIPANLFLDWQIEAQRLGAALPIPTEDSRQSVMQLCSNGISFSGLTIETLVDCGAKLIECSPETGLPAYEFTMINDRTSARGPKPLMWIYNQVMAFVSNKPSSAEQSKTTTSLCRIALVEVDDGLAIDFSSSFQVKVSFPRFLLRVLPVSKSRAEQQGSLAVSKFVQKGVADSLQRFEQAFLDSML